MSQVPERPDPPVRKAWDYDQLKAARIERDAEKLRRGGKLFVVLVVALVAGIGGLVLWAGGPAPHPELRDPDRTVVPSGAPVTGTITQEQLETAMDEQFEVLLASGGTDQANQQLEVLRASFPACEFYATSQNAATRGEALAAYEGAVGRLKERLGTDSILLAARFAEAPGGGVYWAALAAVC